MPLERPPRLSIRPRHPTLPTSLPTPPPAQPPSVQIWWREANPCYDASSDDLGYVAGRFVVLCTVALLFSTTMPDIGTNEDVVAWFLVFSTVFIFGTVLYTAVHFDKIDAVQVIYIGEDGSEEAGSRPTDDNTGNVKQHKRKLVRSPGDVRRPA